MLYKVKVCNSMISRMYILQSDHHKLGLKSYCLKFTEFQFSGLSTSVFSLKGKISCFVLICLRNQRAVLRIETESWGKTASHLVFATNTGEFWSQSEPPLRTSLWDRGWLDGQTVSLTVFSPSQCRRALMRNQGEADTRGARITVWHKTSTSSLEPLHLFGDWTCVRPGTSRLARF